MPGVTDWHGPKGPTDWVVFTDDMNACRYQWCDICIGVRNSTSSKDFCARLEVLRVPVFLRAELVARIKRADERTCDRKSMIAQPT